MGQYYYVSGTYQATWSTANSTTSLDDGIPGDTSTFISQTTSIRDELTFSLMYDYGVRGLISASQFTWEMTSKDVPQLDYILEGSNDASTWNTIIATQIVPDTSIVSGFQTFEKSALSGGYRYYRLSLDLTDDVAFTFNVSDWRLSLIPAFPNVSFVADLQVGLSDENERINYLTHEQFISTEKNINVQQGDIESSPNTL